MSSCTNTIHGLVSPPIARAVPLECREPYRHSRYILTAGVSVLVARLGQAVLVLSRYADPDLREIACCSAMCGVAGLLKPSVVLRAARCRSQGKPELCPLFPTRSCAVCARSPPVVASDSLERLQHDNRVASDNLATRTALAWWSLIWSCVGGRGAIPPCRA